MISQFSKNALKQKMFGYTVIGILKQPTQILNKHSFKKTLWDGKPIPSTR